jgi:hypothetical protein
VNSINPLAKVYDGFILLSSLNQKIRTDLNAPVWKISTEFDVQGGEANARQPNTICFTRGKVGERHTWIIT